jgi:peptidoglycan/LPS O-acetylase OafA/YrhL
MMADLNIPVKKFRPEIEGVRAVAALLVAIYHIWLGKVSGGVDVFFIVSGFLITTSLLSKMERDGRINYFEYVLGLAKRLFPIAFTVLFCTSLVSIFLMPQVQWKQIISETFSSAFYYQNWQLANNAVDYLAQNNQASPYQHFWALSVQGQFYVTWPIIILLAYFIAKKVLKTPVRKTLLIFLMLIFIGSLAYSIFITATNQPWAYFDTVARAWEFSLGGLLALAIPYFHFKKIVSLLLGWLGLAIIGLTGILLPVSTIFPGYAALLPTAGVILVIIAAENPSKFGVERLLGSKPFLSFGNISYGFYLWHWPLLIFYYAYFGVETVSLLGGIGIMLAAFLLAMVSVKGIEKPVRNMNIKHSKKRLVAVLATFMLPVFLFNMYWKVAVDQTIEAIALSSYTEESIETLMEDYPGARAISQQVEPTPNLDFIPSTLHVKEHLPAFYDNKDCYSEFNEPTAKVCSYGETENPDYTIALVGGSHSGHWFPALEEMVEDLNLRIDVYNKDACRFSDDNFDGQLHDTCMEWNEKILDLLIADPPDYVFTTANVGKGDTIPVGFLNQWRKLEGISQVFAVRDNPRMLVDPTICLDKGELSQCTAPRNEVLSDILPWDNTEDIPSNVTFADLSDYFCDDETCYPVIGNVLVYRDLHHISTLYAKTLASALLEPLSFALGSLGDGDEGTGLLSQP